MFEQPKYQRLKLIDAKDFDSDGVLRLQHRFFAPLALALCFLTPAGVSKLWYNDALSGLLYGGVVLRVVLWHAVFCINSWAHIVGEQRYSLGVTAKGNLALSVITNGEGWHNFHHSFPRDYRLVLFSFDCRESKLTISHSQKRRRLVPLGPDQMAYPRL